jgi:hypothetical protein
MNNDQYAISQSFSLLKTKYSFLLLTKCIFEFQNKFNLNILNKQHENDIQQCQLSNPELPSYISQTFNNFYLFSEIKSLLDKTSKIKNLKSKPNILNKLESVDDKQHVIDFIKIIILINLIKKQLKNKSNDEISHYNLSQQINEINPNLLNVLNLNYYQSLISKEERNNYIQYNIHSELKNALNNDDDYDKLYELFQMFI